MADETFPGTEQGVGEKETKMDKGKRRKNRKSNREQARYLSTVTNHVPLRG